MFPRHVRRLWLAESAVLRGDVRLVHSAGDVQREHDKRSVSVAGAAPPRFSSFGEARHPSAGYGSRMNSFNAMNLAPIEVDKHDDRPRSHLTNGSMNRSKGITIGYWIATSLFAMQMGFTAYAQLRLPQVAAAFTHLGFPAYFRVELSWLKLAGILVLLLPAPDRLKEWTYAGFAITLGSAVFAHLAVGDDASKWSWAAGTAVLGAMSYFFFRKLAPREGRGAMKSHPTP